MALSPALLQFLKKTYGNKPAPVPPQQQQQGGVARTVAGDVKEGAGAVKTASSVLGKNAPKWLGQAGSVAGRYVLPGVGAALGAYGLAKDRGTIGSNLMNGATTGASTGTM